MGAPQNGGRGTDCDQQSLQVSLCVGRGVAPDDGLPMRQDGGVKSSGHGKGGGGNISGHSNPKREHEKTLLLLICPAGSTPMFFQVAEPPSISSTPSFHRCHPCIRFVACEDRI